MKNNCACNTFIVEEKTAYKAILDRQGLKCVECIEGSFEKVYCSECFKDYSVDDFKEIKLNF